MCLEYYPECGDGGDGCCERSLRRAFGNRKSIPSRSVVPPIHVRRVDFQLYAVWCDKSESRVASCIEACCRVCAKADFISAHFWDEGLAAPSLAHALSGEEPLPKQVFAGDYDLKGMGGGQVVAEGCVRRDTGEVRIGNGQHVITIPDCAHRLAQER